MSIRRDDDGWYLIECDNCHTIADERHIGPQDATQWARSRFWRRVGYRKRYLWHCNRCWRPAKGQVDHVMPW